MSGDFDAADESCMDETFRALADADRRFVLRYLDRNGATTVSTLGHHLAARRNDTVPAAVTETQRREATIRLHHAHVPKLASAGLVERPDGDDLVEPTAYLTSVLASIPVDLSSGSGFCPGESTALD
ncbi:helix-turn-helix domain-containing protein [Halomarina rubra]|uniref:Helix-turn-helix domain-containing protein n=1 Tax=Halomarina rubra TaxID=2071873 RepID=A0ABD6B060_9EURY|nr:helix-turn-helix domain-containing protein [Halomarina rubra]